MKIHPLHSWDLTPNEAIEIQRELAPRVDTQTPLTKCELIAGADISYNRYSSRHYAVVIVLRLSDWTVLEKQEAVGEVSFPYVPGLLSFREAPVLLEAFAKVQAEPDVVMCDGQGLAHQRRLGLACHIGLFLDVPSLGCAKSRLIGKFTEPGKEARSVSPLVDRGEVVGSVVRTKTNVQPVYVSPGHRIDLASSVQVVLASGHGYRIPEPTRLAHLHVNELRRRESG
jgi:deoxyribonuclease V